MTNEQIKKFLQKAKNYAEKRHLGHLADDFAQESVVAYIRGRKANFNQLFIDFLRKEYGNQRFPRDYNEQHRQYIEFSIDDAEHMSNSFLQLELSEATDRRGIREYARIDRENWRDRVFFKRGRNKANKKKKTISTEHVFELIERDFSRSEIAEIFSVTESRISQIIKDIKKEVENAIVISSSNYYDNSKLNINWLIL